jgi:hypothetical protein
MTPSLSDNYAQDHGFYGMLPAVKTGSPVGHLQPPPMAPEHGACGKEGVAACATPYSESAAAWILGLGDTAGFAALAGTSAAEPAAMHPQHYDQARDNRGGAATDGNLWAGSGQRLELQRSGSGTASKPASGGSNSLGGSMKPPVKQRAQKAWRNRAKEKLQHAAAQLDTLQQEVQQLSVARGALERRNQAIERVLQLAPATADSSMAGTALSRQQDAAGAHAAPELGRTSAPWWLDGRVQAQLAGELGIDGCLVFTVNEDCPITLTQQEVAAMPHQAFGRLWSEYVTAMAACLLESRLGSQEAASRLDCLVREAKRLELCVLLEAPDQMQLQVRQPDAAALAAVHEAFAWPHELWWQLLDSAQFTGHQKARLLQLRETYLRNVAQLAKARAAFEEEQPSSDDPAGLSESAAAGLRRTSTSVCQIGRLLQQEQKLFLRTISAMWAVLSPAQYAHLNVASPVHTSLLCAAEVYATTSGQLSTEAALDRYLAEDDSRSSALMAGFALGGLLPG